MLKTTTEIAARYFETSDEVWAFVRECDAVGIAAGFPSLKRGELGYSVQYLDKSAVARIPRPGATGACPKCGERSPDGLRCSTCAV